MRIIHADVRELETTAREPSQHGARKPARKVSPERVAQNKRIAERAPRRPLSPHLQAHKSPRKTEQVKPGNKKWWHTLTREEQQLYVKEHPKTKFKVTEKTDTGRQRPRIVNPAHNKSPIDLSNPTSPDDGAEPAAPGKRLSLRELVERASKTLSPRDFAWMFSGNKSRYKNIQQEMAQIPVKPNKGDKDYKEKLAQYNKAVEQEKARAAERQADVPQHIKSTAQQAAKLAAAGPLPEAQGGKAAVKQLFGHLVGQSDNKIIRSVEKKLSARQRHLLGAALQHAQENPHEENPPERYRPSLKRVLITALLYGAGVALLGPAGVFLVTENLDKFANKTGMDLDKFAWHALVKGRPLDEPAEKDDEKTTTDPQHAAIERIIKYLKQQLRDAENDKDARATETLIDTLSKRLDYYEDLLADKPRQRERQAAAHLITI